MFKYSVLMNVLHFAVILAWIAANSMWQWCRLGCSIYLITITNFYPNPGSSFMCCCQKDPGNHCLLAIDPCVLHSLISPVQLAPGILFWHIESNSCLTDRPAPGVSVELAIPAPWGWCLSAPGGPCTSGQLKLISRNTQVSDRLVFGRSFSSGWHHEGAA